MNFPTVHSPDRLRQRRIASHLTADRPQESAKREREVRFGTCRRQHTALRTSDLCHGQARRQLGWTAQVKLADRIALTVQWLREQLVTSGELSA